MCVYPYRCHYAFEWSALLGASFLMDRAHSPGADAACGHCGYADWCRHESHGELRGFHQGEEGGGPIDFQTLRASPIQSRQSRRARTVAARAARRSHRLASYRGEAYAFPYVRRLQNKNVQIGVLGEAMESQRRKALL